MFIRGSFTGFDSASTQRTIRGSGGARTKCGQCAPSGDPQAKQLLGLCLLEVQDWPAAAIQLEQAAKLAPEVASTHFSLGCVYEEIGRLDEASRCFRRTITLNPAHVQALCRLGQSLIQDLDYPSALDLAERAFAVEPDSPAGRTLMAGALAGLKPQRAHIVMRFGSWNWSRPRPARSSCSVRPPPVPRRNEKTEASFFLRDHHGLARELCLLRTGPCAQGSGR